MCAGKSIGLFGGSFDPPHKGHIVAAREALEKAKLDEIVFVPANVSPLKVGRMSASNDDRLVMLRLAVADEPRFKVSDYELRRSGVSFTIDTVRHFRAAHPDDELAFIIGADAFATLHQWKDADELKKLCGFVVVERTHPASSTEIRKCFAGDETSCEVAKLRNCEIINAFLSPAVAEYIRRHKLYI